MAKSRYAQDTTVSSDRSRAEIEKLLARYGADGFAYATSNDQAMVGFRMRGRMIRYTLSMPDPGSPEFQETPSRKWRRSPEEAVKAYDVACRQRWRVLALGIKAKLEMTEVGVSTFEEEFLAWTVLPDNTTVGDQVLVRIAEAYKEGKTPQMLLSGIL